MSFSRTEFRKRYGPWALVAGASEGLGAEFGRQLAARGVHVVLLARRERLLHEVAREIEATHGTQVRPVALDLADDDTVARIQSVTADLEIGLLVYNAAYSVIAPFLDGPIARHLTELEVNCRKPAQLCHLFGGHMRQRRRGGILLMSSLSAAQGSPFISHYAATKAYDRILAEGLWGELRAHGVDVLACCAGATRTPKYLAGQPDGGSSIFVPEMEPDAVVREALAALGNPPSMIPGRANRIAAFFMQHLLPRRVAITLMANATRNLKSD